MKIKPEINGSTLKWMAIITMLIDHVGAVLLETFLLNARGSSPFAGHWTAEQWNAIYQADMILRHIGRLSFPIFCFLLVEGFLHTRDIKKYAVRLGMFAVISEIPFDLALGIKMIYWEYQNVYFTLLIGLLTIWCMQIYGNSLTERLMILLVGGVLADCLHTDYGIYGVGLIGILYLTRDHRMNQCVLGALVSLTEILKTVSLAFIPIYFYNGQRGRQPKWLFYWFYPVHFLVLYLVGAYVFPMMML
ncbi:MAG: conjugal transfer protein TraX [Lachnospiraceae bacterium]|nr:conjugal transfer protein TraX [Lachnospiraceae bacterium]